MSASLVFGGVTASHVFTFFSRRPWVTAGEGGKGLGETLSLSGMGMVLGKDVRNG